MNNENLIDWRGKRITVGKTVVYAVMQSSSVTMKEGVVTRIDWVDHRWHADKKVPVLYVKSGRAHKWGGNAPGKIVKLTAVDRVTVI